jgi:hypothetical protein
MNRSIFGATLALILIGNTQIQAVELLVSGDFEDPIGQSEVRGWTLEEFETPGGGGGPIDNTAELDTAASAQDGPKQLFLQSFVGNGALDPNDGNFDNDNLPAGDVDGNDFLAWQRGSSPTPLSQADLTTWEGNYGRVGGQEANAVLSQTVAAVPSETYTFSGWSRWEDNYSGGAGTLDASSPLGPVATPTTNTMKVEFLNAGGSVIGSHTLDLLVDGQVNLDLWKQHSITTDAAPSGTANIRVTAEARDMVFNTDPLQGAFYDSFSLTAASDPNNTQLLTNAGLDDPPASALDFWTLTEGPEFIGSDEILRTANFANHTPGGSLGVWLSAFFGGGSNRVVNWPDDPVFGTMEQTVAIVGGGTYNFSGWTFFEPNYSGGVDIIDPNSEAFPPSLFAGMASPTQTLITLEFLDPNGAVLSTSTIDAKADRLAQIGCDPSCSNSAANDSTWHEHTFTDVVAPVGAVSARLSGKMIDGVFNKDEGGGQSAFFDDFSLDGPAGIVAAVGTVPEPTSAMGLALGAMLFSLRGYRRRVEG